MSLAQIPGIKGLSKDAERPAPSNCPYYPERNEEIKQILRTTRLCAGSEPVTSTNRSCTPTNLSHSRGVLSKQDVNQLGTLFVTGTNALDIGVLSSLFESRWFSGQLSTVHFVSPPCFHFIRAIKLLSDLFPYWRWKPPNISFSKTRAPCMDNLAASMSVVQARRCLSLSLSLSLSLTLSLSLSLSLSHVAVKYTVCPLRWRAQRRNSFQATN